MAYKRLPAPPAHNHPELVSELARRLAKPDDQRGPGIPDILEQELAYGQKLQVHVIWDRWEGIGADERGPIILDAYERARGLPAMLQVTSALGFTPAEADKLNIRFPVEAPAAKSPKRKKHG